MATRITDGDGVVESALSTDNDPAVATVAAAAAHVPVDADAHPGHHHRRRRALLEDLVAGGVAGTVGVAAGYPLDSIKVRTQMMMTAAAGAATAATRDNRAAKATTTARSSPLLGDGAVGSRSLWRGMGAPLSVAAGVNASIFLTYGWSGRYYDEHWRQRRRRDTYNDARDISIERTAFCAAAAGTASSLVVCPSEHVKTKLQTQKERQRPRTTPRASAAVDARLPPRHYYRDSFHAARVILSDHGVVGLYRGLVPTACRQVPGLFVYFGTYERLKSRLLESNSRAVDVLGAKACCVLAGGTAGSVSWTAIYPADLVKSRVQSLPVDCDPRERSALRIVRDVLRAEGWGGMYRGLGVTVLRAFPVNGIIFLTYEFTLKLLRGHGAS